MRTALVGVSALGVVAGCGSTSHTTTGAETSPTNLSASESSSSATSPEPTTVAPTLLPTDAYARPSDPTMPLDVVSAERVFEALYPLRARAIYEHDAATIAAIETGAAREYDVARCHSGCPEPEPQSALVPHTFSAPPQVGYPVFF